MSILEILGLLTLLVSVFTLGYTIGKDIYRKKH